MLKANLGRQRFNHTDIYHKYSRQYMDHINLTDVVLVMICFTALKFRKRHFFLLPQDKKHSCSKYGVPTFLLYSVHTSHLFHLIHFRYVELKHILNTIFQGNCGAGTACAGANQFQLHSAIFKTLKDNITPILLHGGSV